MEKVRIDQAEKARRRLGANLAAHILSDRTLDDLVRMISDEALARTCALPAFRQTARAIAQYAVAGGGR